MNQIFSIDNRFIQLLNKIFVLHGSISFGFYVVFLFLQSVPRQLPFIMFHSNSYATKKAILQSSSLLHFVLILKKPI